MTLFLRYDRHPAVRRGDHTGSGDPFRVPEEGGEESPDPRENGGRDDAREKYTVSKSGDNPEDDEARRTHREVRAGQANEHGSGDPRT